METLQKFALAITIIGALNWGVVGVFRFDVIAHLADSAYAFLARFLYILIGAAGLLSLGLLFSHWHQSSENENPPT